MLNFLNEATRNHLTITRNIVQTKNKKTSRQILVSSTPQLEDAAARAQLVNIEPAVTQNLLGFPTNNSMDQNTTTGPN